MKSDTGIAPSGGRALKYSSRTGGVETRVMCKFLAA